MDNDFDPYEILGIDRLASQAQINRAYKKLAKLHHPDKGGSAEAFALINEARELLTDAAKRERWDKEGARGGAIRTQENQDNAEVQVELTRLLLKAIQDIGAKNVKYQDLKAHMTKSLMDSKLTTQKTKVEEEGKLEVMKDIKERWETDGPSNNLAAAVQSQVVLIENAIKGCDYLISVNDRVQAALLTYRYRYEARPSPEDLYGFDLKRNPDQSPSPGLLSAPPRVGRGYGSDRY